MRTGISVTGLKAPEIRFTYSDMRGAFTFLTSLLWLVACQGRAVDAPVERHLEPFFEAFLGRELRRDELQQVTHEFVEYHGLHGRDRPAVLEAAARFGKFANTLRDGESGPAALSLRHTRIAANFFDPDVQNTLFLRLLTAPDPVRVVDVQSRRLMTERDVIALANIRHFARSKGAPRHEELSRQQIEQMIALLRATVGGNSGNMPQFFGEAAAFWAGVQQEWPDLDAEQRQLVRAYADRMWRIQIPAELYGRLWGLDPQAASSRHADDVSARIAAITDLNMLLGNLPFVMDAIFGR
jgi:hypothetical protein